MKKVRKNKERVLFFFEKFLCDVAIFYFCNVFAFRNQNLKYFFVVESGAPNKVVDEEVASDYVSHTEKYEVEWVNQLFF